jgi:hypothetical protein
MILFHEASGLIGLSFTRLYKTTKAFWLMCEEFASTIFQTLMSNAITSGITMSKNSTKFPDWDQVISSAARLQKILPDAVLVGGTASAIYAKHRISGDDDHVLLNLRHHFDEILADLESVAGWKTARTKKPVLILGNLNGIETGVRQLIRDDPLETTALEIEGQRIIVPTEAEILRIKAVLILKRNATRDYLDFVALAGHLTDDLAADALKSFDKLYPQKSGESSLQQLLAQLAKPLPFDLKDIDLKLYKQLAERWQKWPAVEAACAKLAVSIFEKICSLEIN